MYWWGSSAVRNASDAARAVRRFRLLEAEVRLRSADARSECYMTARAKDDFGVLALFWGGTPIPFCRSQTAVEKRQTDGKSEKNPNTPL